jgi:hypothetical protein
MILERVSQKSKGANHVTISISGWLSEHTDKIDHWEDLKSYLGEDEAVYSLTWESNTVENLKSEIKKCVGKIVLGSALSYAAPVSRAMRLLAVSNKSLLEIS